MPTLDRSTANLVGGLLALALTAGLVIRTSSAVFTAETNNTGNSLEAGTIVLTDDDAGATALTISNLAPGEFSQNCIVVEYDGSLDPEAVNVFSTSDFVPSVAGMEDQVNITIEEGDGTSSGAFGSCAGFSPGTTLVNAEVLSAWDARATDYTTGDGQWDPVLDPAPQGRMYRITLELDLATDNTYQGASLSGINISWATRSTASPGLVP